ncbi:MULTISPECIES: DEAD/DEAH box helicase family protein [Halomonadaceae]|uniref:DEAD/DEAH box helicase family protein n=2 Tax=Vreelandella TaxID=3137766 RepID=A0A7Z0LPW0_9GAMM|nr:MULTISPECIES: DEAD/DEAH box helicase family protein [Halomonas]NYS76362.1 DEAD/DEAH box helicase family protein [Halomonas glaciei]|tara:strand:- start:418 stop:3774 length:3357 start_codon:yes stop_codon:yes gene_type:complete
MAGKPRQAKIRVLSAKNDFLKKLVLNQWVMTRFGIDPLEQYRDKGSQVRPVTLLNKNLKESQPGLTGDRHHHYLHALLGGYQSSWQYSEEDLKRFDANIVEHTDALNQQREVEVEWKYFQWLTLLFVEIYLFEYFRDREALKEGLNAQVDRFNAFWQGQGYQTGIGRYQDEDLNKLCLQNATGSGKTLLMHTNVRQFRHYARQHQRIGDYGQIILITPNERLSDQHLLECRESSLEAERLSQDGGDLFSGERRSLSRVAISEITKLGIEQGKKKMAVDSFGDGNLLLVDEGHRGLGSASEEKGWLSHRNKLAGRGFTFEYSATFKEAVVAAGDNGVEESYAKNILFDYGYRYFYEDGYGKDYRIFNLPEKETRQRYTYLTAALLAFYQQQRYFREEHRELSQWNLAVPLWVFVGASVVKDDGSKESAKNYNERASDIAQVLGFLAWFLGEKEQAKQALSAVYQGDAASAGLIDKQGNEIFSGSFPWLKEQQLTVEALYRDILTLTFHAAGGGTLNVDRITGDSGELLLKVGEAEKPFGLINVGDALGLAEHLESHDIKHLQVRKSELANPIFAEVTRESSPVNLLIGSKKFVEGWNCWRVSSMGLMNTGKKEGSQIIQLFGRGVRLKGRDMSLMRSSRLDPILAPKYLYLLETLNVFGVGADFMATFRDFLEDEGLPGNDNPEVHTLKLNVMEDVGKSLKMLRPKVRQDTRQAYSFHRDGPLVRFGYPVISGDFQSPLGLTPDIVLKERRVELDRYPKVDSIQASGVKEVMAKPGLAKQHARYFDDDRLLFLDMTALARDLERYRRNRGYANVLIDAHRLPALLKSQLWYNLLVPDDQWKLHADNFQRYQSMALELLSLLLDRIFNFHRRAYLEPRMELVALEEANGNLPATNEYQLVVDGSESALIDDIKQMKAAIEQQQKATYRSSKANGVSAVQIGAHLYNPLLHLGKDSRIRVEPVALNDSEFRFVEDLTAWLERNQQAIAERGEQVYLLRNLVKQGIGFFEAGGFYPDFILWHVNQDRQRIVFVDPHGVRHTGPKDEKIEFSERIKDVQRRLKNEHVELESVILAPSSTTSAWVNSHWGMTAEELRAKHVLFMSDSDYLDRLMQMVTATVVPS